MKLDDWAIKDHFRPKFYKSDPTRRIVKCKDTECPFYIRASFKEGLGVVIVADTFQPQHTCLGAAVENARAPAKYTGLASTDIANNYSDYKRYYPKCDY